MHHEERFSRDRLTNVDHGAVASGVMRIVDPSERRKAYRCVKRNFSTLYVSGSASHPGRHTPS